MSLLQHLTDEMKVSMKSGDSVKTGVIRLLRGAIKNEEIKLGHELEDPEAMKVLSREAKQRKDSIDAYTAAQRPDLAAIEAAELEIIAGYLPQPLSEAELVALITAEIARSNVSDVRQMGAVIGAVSSQAGARADGATIARLVRAHLADHS